MRFVRAVLVLLAFAALPAAAQEQAFTNRSTELKDRADGATVATLPENTPVKVLQRAGGWTRVEANGRPGWVRVFHLRFAAQAQTGSGNVFTGIGGALGLGGSNTKQANLATTGIRGLSQEDLKNASPDPEQLRRMQSFRADKAAAERFAREGKLAEARVEAPEGGSR